MRHFLWVAIAGFPALTLAQAPALTRTDSTLIGRILQAEDRRDTTDAALAQGARHADARVRTLAKRAISRTRDARFPDRTAPSM